jgi:hypothetical protein
VLTRGIDEVAGGDATRISEDCETGWAQRARDRRGNERAIRVLVEHIRRDHDIERAEIRR